MDTDRYDPETQRALRLFVVLTRCYNSVAEHARQDIARHGLSGSEFGVLELLYHKGPTSLGVIAERILLTTGSLTYVIDQLEKQGLARRIACPTDRRVCYADLTEAGRERIQQIFPEHAARIRQALSGLAPDEQEAAIALLKKLGLSAQEPR
ncbi:MAG TPA: MarR family transcriptional regulator [Chthonomonadaceae bacterium]|nr:MarR family transcriptional regulator [Chthonomonadaceae bacterium]